MHAGWRCCYEESHFNLIGTFLKSKKMIATSLGLPQAGFKWLHISNKISILPLCQPFDKTRNVYSPPLYFSFKLLSFSLTVSILAVRLLPISTFIDSLYRTSRPSAGLSLLTSPWPPWPLCYWAQLVSISAIWSVRGRWLNARGKSCKSAACHS